MRRAYLDSSAAVKLVLDEPESGALRSWLRGRDVASSSVLRTELIRAVRPQGESAIRRALAVAQRFHLSRISSLVLNRAAIVGPVELRTLDALHLATAVLMSDEVAALITYDRRLASAARDLGLRVASPS